MEGCSDWSCRPSARHSSDSPPPLATPSDDLQWQHVGPRRPADPSSGRKLLRYIVVGRAGRGRRWPAVLPPFGPPLVTPMPPNHVPCLSPTSIEPTSAPHTNSHAPRSCSRGVSNVRCRRRARMSQYGTAGEVCASAGLKCRTFDWTAANLCFGRSACAQIRSHAAKGLGILLG